MQERWNDDMKVVIVGGVAGGATDAARIRRLDEQPELAAQFGVMSIPTLVVMKGGKVANQMVGARPKSQILAML